MPEALALPRLAVILGSGRGVRYLDPTRSYPTALAPVPGLGTVLSWTVRALEDAAVDRVVFVGGYHIEKVVEAFPLAGARRL